VVHWHLESCILVRGHCRRWITVSLDQITDFRRDDIIIAILKLGHSINKAKNLRVDARLVSRTGKIVDHRLDPIRCHIAERPENATEDKTQVYNVAHHKRDLLPATEGVEADYVTQDEQTHLFS
jgi:hypothetical protein